MFQREIGQPESVGKHLRQRGFFPGELIGFFQGDTIKQETAADRYAMGNNSVIG